MEAGFPVQGRQSAYFVSPAMTSGGRLPRRQTAPSGVGAFLPFTSGLRALGLRLRELQSTGFRMRRSLVTAIALALASAGSIAAAAPAPAAPPVLDATTQLPRSVRPTHYDVAVVPHADKLSFDGRVAISV